MGTPKRSKYDDEAVVVDIAHGEMTYAQIGEKHGLSEVMVGQIARGDRRPQLLARIDAVTEGMREHARRLGARLATVAMGQLGTLAGANSDAPHDVRRRAAVDILTFALGDPAKPEVNVNQMQINAPDLTQLSAKTKKQVLKELGGPVDEKDDGRSK